MNQMPASETRRSGFIYLRLLWGNLAVHPVRSGLSAVAIALEYLFNSADCRAHDGNPQRLPHAHRRCWRRHYDSAAELLHVCCI